MNYSLATLFVASALWAAAASATPFTFSTGDPDGKIATGSQPSSAGKIEIESADDFVLTQQTQINHATFTGLLTGGASLTDIGNVIVEIYRVFPEDSDVGRTSGSPTFSTVNVPTRTNSPSDVEFQSRDFSDSTLSFTTTVLDNNFTVDNSVLNGINPQPNQTTGGEGPVTGEVVQFDVSFSTPFLLPADHYFFVPQVEITIADGNFLWLSASKPITGGTGPFAPDLQSWIRDENLAPDWLRIGTDIVGGSPAPTFNAAFSLDGQTVPEPGTLLLFMGGFAVFFVIQRSGQRHQMRA